jgi:putative membrane protein
MIGGWIMMLVFRGLIIASIIILVRALSGRNVLGHSRRDSALEILRRRYAAGEITREQFQEMKRTLG